MPLDMGASVPMDMPDDLMAAADEADAMVEDELSALMPPFEKPINVKVLNALAKAIAQASKVMGFEVVPETYTEPATELEPAVVRFLAMISAAAEDFGKPLPVSLDAVRTEQDLTTITAAIMQLAKDKAFADFLDMPAAGEDDADVQVDIEVGTPEGDMDEDFDFASRMRPRM